MTTEKDQSREELPKSTRAFAVIARQESGVEFIRMREEDAEKDERPELVGRGVAFLIERLRTTGTDLWFVCAEQGHQAGYSVGGAGELIVYWDNEPRLTIAGGQWATVHAVGTSGN